MSEFFFQADSASFVLLDVEGRLQGFSSSVVDLFPCTSVFANTTGSHFGTSSWASKSVSSSYALSASFAPGSPSVSASYADRSFSSNTSSYSSQSFWSVSSSFTSESIISKSSSFASSSLSSSFLTLGRYTTSDLTSSVSGAHTGSTFGTASWSNNSITASQGCKAWGYWSYNGSVLVSTTYGCVITRGALGLYNILFTIPVTNAQYSVQLSGHSGSLDASSTGSLGWAMKQTTTGFTASYQKITALTLLADVTTGSVTVFSY